MGDLIRRMSTRTKNWIFGVVFAICFILALMPPLYLEGARIEPRIFGFPFGIAYMIFDGLLITISIMVLYLVERARNEIE